MKRYTTILIVIICLVLSTGGVQAVQLESLSGAERLKVIANPDLMAAINQAGQSEKVGIIIQFEDQTQPMLASLAMSDEGVDRGQRSSQVLSALQTQASTSQGGVQQFLEEQAALGNAEAGTTLWIINGIYTAATPAVIQAIAQFPEVKEVRLNEEFTAEPFDPSMQAAVVDPLTYSRITDLWALGFRGKGVVVASLDSGVDYTHPALLNRYRGKTNSWYDPFKQHLMPADVAGTGTGHGTATMSVMVGSDGVSLGPGAAPEAQWIAAKIYDDLGRTNAYVIHLAYQWVLDPDRNPMTDDAPDVVNNSWAYSTGSCKPEFRSDLAALRAAGILPIFSSGNYGPGVDTSPGNYPEAFSVGALNSSYTIASYTSRGYSSCDGQVFPDVVAPGDNIKTANIGGGYSLRSGTSFSAPQVAGGLALLLSAYPELPVSIQEKALLAGANDRGPQGPDPTYGNGSMDFLKAYKWLVDYKNRPIQVYLPFVKN